MNKLDRMIEEALAAEDREILEETQELGLFQQMAGQYRGPNAWVNWLNTLGLFAYGALALWAALRFFTASGAEALVFWGVLLTVAIVAVAAIKLYMLGKVETDRVLRELKRVELMLAAREK